MGAAKNKLGELDLEKKAERRTVRRRRKAYPEGGNTRIAKARRAGQRKPVPVPKGKSLIEVREMDPHDEGFRHKVGRKRRWHNPDGSPKEKPASWKDEVRAYRQRKANDRRARVRKYEAEVILAQKVIKNKSKPQADGTQIDIYDEDKLVAESILDLEDWDDEELIRGYRRNRNGKFGVAPKYIPRELQQEAFRRLIARGDRTMKGAYVKSINKLVDLAQNADSEKVRLDAIKTVLERVAGKVPDKVLVAREEPWEGILADAIVPLSEADPIELIPGDDGAYMLEPLADSEGEVETPAGSDAARSSPSRRVAPSPSRRSRKKKPDAKS